VKATSRTFYSARWDKMKAVIAARPASVAETFAPVSVVAMDAEFTAAYVGAEILAADEAGGAAGTGSWLSRANPLARVPVRYWRGLGRASLVLDSVYTSWLVAGDYGRWQGGSLPTDEFMASSSI